MKSKLLKRLRKRAEANIYVVYDPSYMYKWGWCYRIYKFSDKDTIHEHTRKKAIELCKHHRREWILEKARKISKRKRIF